MKVFMLMYFAAFIFLTIGCSKNKKYEKLPSRKFAIDSALVEKQENFSKERFSFHPPLHWLRLPKDVFGELKESLKTSLPREKGIIYTPIDLFYNADNKSILYITTVSFLGVKEDPFLEYDKVINNGPDKTSIEPSMFIKDDIVFAEYIIRKEDRVDLKILFCTQGNSLVQFDYFFPDKAYNSEINKVNSSLGTLRIID